MTTPVPIPDLMHPAKRRESGLTWAELVRAATELARRYERAHASRQVVGDANLGVGADGSIEEVDASRQLDLSAPETKGRGGVHAPEPNQDVFGLALQAFAILFGHHPFIGTRPDGSIPDVQEAIARRAYVHARDSDARASEWVASPAIAGEDIAILFERAFAGDPATSTRPTAREWVKALEALEASLETCAVPKRHRHRYHRKLKECPWCALLDRGAVEPFPIPAFTVKPADADIEASKATIESVISTCQQIIRRRAAWPELTSEATAKEAVGRQETDAPAADQAIEEQERDRLIEAAVTAERRDRMQALALSGALAVATIVAGTALEGALRLTAVPLVILAGLAYHVLTAHGSAEPLFAAIESLDARRIQTSPEKASLGEDEAERLLEALERESAEATGRLNACHKRWDEQRRSANRIDDNLRRQAVEVRDAALALEKAIADAPAEARRQGRSASTARHLRTKMIGDATIPQIDVGTKSNLTLYGIASAQDVLEKDLWMVPGIGDGRAGALRAWATDLRKRAPYTDVDWPQRVAPVIAKAQGEAMALKDHSDGLARIASECDAAMGRLHARLTKVATDALATKRSAKDRAGRLGIEMEDASAPPDHKPIRIPATPTPWRRTRRWQRRRR